MYITGRRLEPWYPSGVGIYATNCRALELGSEEFLSEVPLSRNADHPLGIGLLGMLEQTYKGPKFLLKAVTVCNFRIKEIDGGPHD